MTDDLLAMLGHDLRNPGTTLVSCLEYLDELVLDPDGREALEDAQASLRQLQSAWARIDALSGRSEPRWERVADVAPALGQLAERAGANYEGPRHRLAPSGVVFIVEALVECTRGATLTVSERAVCVTDGRGPLPPQWRPVAFEARAQPQLKQLGRYARFVGLVAARQVARQLGLELRATERSLFELELPP